MFNNFGKHISCSKCGSKNTELRDRPPHKNADLLDRLKDLFISLSFDINGIPMGQKFIVCKDCGHVSCIQIM